jgi:hypothetical protein
MSSGPNLWWVYDSENQSFSALPPGPFLLPVLIFSAIFSLFSSGGQRVTNLKGVAGHLADTPEWQAKHARYYYLIEKSAKFNGDIPLQESIELDRLGAYLHNPYGN